MPFILKYAPPLPIFKSEILKSTERKILFFLIRFCHKNKIYIDLLYDKILL